MRRFALILLCAALCCWGRPARSASEDVQTVYVEGPSRAGVALRQGSDGKLFVVASVQGQALVLMVDTGATTILDLTVARRLALVLKDTSDVGYGLTGVTATRKTANLDLQLGAMKITHFPVSCLDLTPARTLHRDLHMPVFDGVIGSDLMALLRARIDFDRRTLEIRRPAAGRLTGSSR